MHSTTELAVRVRNLVKRYADGTEANRGIDLDVRRGEILAIVGANGAGKTTFLRQLTTELRPTSGSIAIFGFDAVAEPGRVKRLMGISPQEAGLFESLGVRQHLELFARLKGLSKRTARVAAREIMTDLELVSDAERRISRLSGGQRRRILIGLALLGRPPLLVLDEPTTGLDPGGRRVVWGVLARARGEGTGIILSTHYMEEAEGLGDRVGIISDGRLTAVGTMAELTARLSRESASLEDVYFELGGGRVIDLEPAREERAREAARGAWSSASDPTGAGLAGSPTRQPRWRARGAPATKR